MQHMRFYITFNLLRENPLTNNIVLNWNFDSRLSEGRNEEMGKTRSTILESRAEVLRRVLQLMYVLLTPVGRSGQGSGLGSGMGSEGEYKGGEFSDTVRERLLHSLKDMMMAEEVRLKERRGDIPDNDRMKQN